MSPQDTQDLMPKNPALEDVFQKVNLGMYQIFHLKNLNLMTDWEYTRVNERQFFPQQISSIHSKMCNVDDNGRDAIQPSLFNTYCGMVNTQQLSMYNKMSQTLSKSPSSNNYKSIYGGLRRYSGNAQAQRAFGLAHECAEPPRPGFLPHRHVRGAFWSARS